jgi:hypothetical protein
MSWMALGRPAVEDRAVLGPGSSLCGKFVPIMNKDNL